MKISTRLGPFCLVFVAWCCWLGVAPVAGHGIGPVPVDSSRGVDAVSSSSLSSSWQLDRFDVRRVLDEATATTSTSTTEQLSGSGNSTTPPATATEGNPNTAEEDEAPADAVLFAPFVITVGVVIYWVLQRYASWMPYTAICFLFGTFLGVASARLTTTNLLHETMAVWWSNIDSEVLLVTFLGGLIFKDSYNMDVHLFQVSMVQSIIMAFPMVLVGAVLTALVGYYIFPYGWSFNLCMTVGSILSATDPVAVAALLEQVGAPPRLKVHIAGESLLNDGSAIVFFSIFSALYFSELQVPGFGQEAGWGTGFAWFFQKSVGGACIGAFFAIGLLLMLHILNRRLHRQENVVQVSATFGVAYLCYFTAEVAWQCSGVIANMTLGVMVRSFGHAVINDMTLMQDFWTLVEHMLNTVLFTLGGLVWGDIIANADPDFPELKFEGRDWGYLVLLYILLTVIRFFLFASFYPIYSRIGLKSSINEMIFQSFGGLRGAVGIALAIYLNNAVRKASGGEYTVFEEQTNKVFGFVGGIAFMTLIFNATTAGPVLAYLGLADVTEMRGKIVHVIQKRWRMSMIDDMVRLLAQPRFQDVTFDVIRSHVHALSDLKYSEFMESVKRYELANSYRDDCKSPHTNNILPYLVGAAKSRNKVEFPEHPDLIPHGDERKNACRKKKRLDRGRINLFFSFRTKDVSIQELRQLFLEMLRSAYEAQIHHGELSNREFVGLSLLQSLNFAMDRVHHGHELSDWDYVNMLRVPWSQSMLNIFAYPLLDRLIPRMLGFHQAHVPSQYAAMRLQVERAMSFIYAHKCAQANLKAEFIGEEFAGAEKLIIDESEAEVRKAQEVLNSFPMKDVEVIVSHMFCNILLHNGARFVSELSEDGMLKEQEADELIEAIQEDVRHLEICDMRSHGGELRGTATMHTDCSGG